MHIHCWGARGSVPVSGKSFLTYGGDTTCIEIRTRDDKVIIIDAGTGIRRAGIRLQEQKKKSCYLLFTHHHLDHIMGFPFFKLIYSGENHITIYSSAYCQPSLQQALSLIMNPPFFPFSFDHIKAVLNFKQIRDESFNIGSASITPIQLNHPGGGSGFKIREDDKSFVFLTDNELGEPYGKGKSFQMYCDFTAGADLLMHDAAFTPEEYQSKKKWGHSSSMVALNLALEAEVKQLGLFHHLPERTDDQIDAMIKKCNHQVVVNTSSLTCFGVTSDFTLEL